MTCSRDVSRRTAALAGLSAGAMAALPLSARAQAKFPSRKMSVIIPTGPGGGAERLARPFADQWSRLLGQPFEFEFHAGAAGQVGYTLYVQKRERDGHNLLFGNMGPETIMYATQKPAYKFPNDYIYFCRTDTDDSCVFISKASPFKKIEDVVAEAKKRTLNVATSRIPHPASIGILALGQATGAKFNLIPFQGGNPTTVAVLSGEVDVGVLPITSVLKLTEKLSIVGIFNRENRFTKYTPAPTINAVFGTKLPDLYSARSWAVHAEFAAKNPEQFKLLDETARKTANDPAYIGAAVKSGETLETLTYGDQKSCLEYALGMIALANEYSSILTAKK